MKRAKKLPILFLSVSLISTHLIIGCAANKKINNLGTSKEASLIDTAITGKDSTTMPLCPVCKTVCSTPNMPLVLGSIVDSDARKHYPRIELRTFICDNCGCLFVRQHGKKYEYFRTQKLAQ